MTCATCVCVCVRGIHLYTQKKKDIEQLQLQRYTATRVKFSRIVFLVIVLFHVCVSCTLFPHCPSVHTLPPHFALASTRLVIHERDATGGQCALYHHST